MSSLYAIGIIPTSDLPWRYDYCENQQLGDRVTAQGKECTQTNLDNSGMIEYITENCLGRKSCQINMSQFVLNTDPSSVCAQIPARVYMQLECTLGPIDQQENKKSDFLAGFIAIFASLVFLFSYLVHIYQTKKYKQKVASQLVQPAAFSCEMMISDQLWSRVIERHKEANTTDSIMAFFGADLEQVIEQRIKPGGASSKNLEVACINWHFTSG